MYFLRQSVSIPGVSARRDNKQKRNLRKSRSPKTFPREDSCKVAHDVGRRDVRTRRNSRKANAARGKKASSKTPAGWRQHGELERADATRDGDEGGERVGGGERQRERRSGTRRRGVGR